MLTKRMRGVTLIELMIGLVILGLLLMMGVPAFTTYLQNAKLRGQAEAMFAGLQLARAEAVSRNGQVEWVLTDDDPVAPTVNTVVPSVNGKNWMVRFFNPTTANYTFIQGRTGQEGSGQATNTTVVTTSTASVVAFTGLGTTTGGGATVQFTNPAGGDCAAAGGPMRCLNVVVAPGGQMKMCDPAVLTVGDTRRC